MLSFSYVPTGPRAESYLKPSIIVHGGAGSGRYAKDDRRYGGLKEAVEAGLSAMKNGSGVDGAVAAVRSMEDSGLFNCGRGACLTAEGKAELDAAVMSAEGLAGAGVGNVTCTHNPVVLARWVMENTEHVLIVGDRCRDYARLAGLGVEELTPSAQTLKRFRALREGAPYRDNLHLVRRFKTGDTVGAAAVGADRVPAAAVSTGGRWMKLPGRVGDSAIIGAGAFAGAGGAASATGSGEDILRVSLSMKAVEMVSRAGAAAGARKAIQLITKVRGRGTAGIVTVDSRGRVGAAYNTESMGRAWWDVEKGRTVATF